MIRHAKDPNKKVNFDKISTKLYSKIGRFIENFIISEMVDRYGLVDVDSPDSTKQESRILYMSKEFYRPDPMVNSKLEALVLIQGGTS